MEGVLGWEFLVLIWGGGRGLGFGLGIVSLCGSLFFWVLVEGTFFVRFLRVGVFI